MSDSEAPVEHIAPLDERLVRREFRRLGIADGGKYANMFREAIRDGRKKAKASNVKERNKEDRADDAESS